jgi:hypothetical protein
MGRGRKPIGRRAMTGAERIARWREKHPAESVVRAALQTKLLRAVDRLLRAKDDAVPAAIARVRAVRNAMLKTKRGHK